jgi:hypothetical protein
MSLQEVQEPFPPICHSSTSTWSPDRCGLLRCAYAAFLRRGGRFPHRGSRIGPPTQIKARNEPRRGTAQLLLQQRFRVQCFFRTMDARKQGRNASVPFVELPYPDVPCAALGQTIDQAKRCVLESDRTLMLQSDALRRIANFSPEDCLRPTGRMPGSRRLVLSFT